MPTIDETVTTPDGTCPVTLHTPNGAGPWTAVVMTEADFDNVLAVAPQASRSSRRHKPPDPVSTKRGLAQSLF